ncbi:DUF2635 domain-containing protein [Vibrio hepatarius]|uniref:DUF2635 domain-containing protein n=1 Tax=Vibrio hepatarius TaxID=171383 RepID=UPI00148E39C6|nr:DUF2635 domain-containing protein [Vibrio hepatarius]NOI14836.1 DUF2635 domain-containing protein [Vibrio hepatarius]
MSTPSITVKPAKKGVKVRKEDGKYLDEKGEQAKRTGFWIRRIKQGDVIDVEAEKAKAAAAKKTKAAPATQDKGE